MVDSSDIQTTGKLQGKVAIVTGGASGIGKATAHLFSDYGARAVVIADIQDNKGMEVAASIRGGSYFRCDVSNESQVNSLVDHIVAEFGRLDVMFSNAGVVSAEDQTVLDLDMSETLTDYTMSKHAILGLVRSASLQLGVHGIRVNSVSPGFVPTPLLKPLFGKETEVIEKFVMSTMSLKIGKVTQPESVAEAVAFLVSDEAQFITGHDLAVDGGYVHRPL